MQGAECPAETPNNDATMRSAHELVPLNTPHVTVEDVIGFDALYISMRKCIKGVLWKDSVAHYYHNWIRETLKLEKELKEGTYRERVPKYFIVTEPKRREIMSISFRDRVYQRSLNDVAIYPQMVRPFIYDNHACQKGKGTKLARDRLKCFLQRYYRKHGQNGYVLQCDVKGYYPNMDHQVAKDVFRKRLQPEIYMMAERILDNFPGEKGFNPGSQIIQIVGISLLNDMDHYIKERLRIKYYIRYMDDFILISDDRAHLERCREEIREILEGLKLQLHPEKTKIYQLSKGIKFLGFVYKLKSTGKVVASVNPEKVKHERKKLRRLARLVKEGKRTREQVDEHLRAVIAHYSYGDNYKLIKRMEEYYKSLWEEGEQRHGADRKTQRDDCRKSPQRKRGGRGRQEQSRPRLYPHARRRGRGRNGGRGMSENYEKVKGYYDNGFWTKKRVRKAVGHWITAEEYELIVGEPYIG